jgi:chromosome segregation protein
MEETLGRLRTLLSGREALFKDFAAAVARAQAGGALPSAAELRKFADGAVSALADASRDAEKARELFDAYRKATPAFIDEFLSPEGIMTKKRTLDAKVRASKDAVAALRDRIAELRTENDGLGVKIEEYACP